MAKKNDGIIWHLMDAPWQLSVILAITTYLGMTYIAPALMLDESNIFLTAIATQLPTIAPYFTFLFLIPAPIAFFKQWNRKQHFLHATTKIKRQKSTEPLKAMNWIEFESYVGEFFKCNGYEVKQQLSPAADGGVDIWLKKEGELSLVQCKQWKTRSVGVQVLREMYGVMLDNQAARMIIVTTGNFTREARQFAKGKRFWLVSGDELVNMVESGKHALSQPKEKSPSQASDITKKICPKCNSELVIRTATKSAYAGSKFYGCSSFPKCRHIENI
ncbi:restriction endonuclease [Vibrio tapetis]|uniref:Restriction endonuclease family protein n=1 Tax=Vibrio tapetis subsp. tapetis TaxID=1671868 RepID=A0A2N8ZBR3_9VIBR|nr:restriction endonuclease [Vibrio tapetis]SON49354.1 Restriction endonuclease family protein [Vibrio tapetis subsp. tapetis]